MWSRKNNYRAERGGIIRLVHVKGEATILTQKIMMFLSDEKLRDPKIKTHDVIVTKEKRLHLRH